MPSRIPVVVASCVAALALLGCSGTRSVESEDEYFSPARSSEAAAETERAPDLYRPRTTSNGRDEALERMVREQNEKVSRLERELMALATQQQIESAERERSASTATGEQTLLALIREQNLRLDEIIEHVRLMAERKGTEPERTLTVTIATPLRPRAPRPQDEQARALYAKAVGSYNRRQYSEAIQLFEAALSRGIRNSLADNCRFWIGVCKFQVKDLPAALGQLEKVVRDPMSDKRASALLMTGQALEQMGRSDLAQNSYRRIVDEHPRSSLRLVAERKLLSRLMMGTAQR